VANSKGGGYLNDKLKFQEFIKKNEQLYNKLMEEFVKLFNRCNVETKSGTAQFILLGAVVKGSVMLLEL